MTNLVELKTIWSNPLWENSLDITREQISEQNKIADNYNTSLEPIIHRLFPGLEIEVMNVWEIDGVDAEKGISIDMAKKLIESPRTLTREDLTTDWFAGISLDAGDTLYLDYPGDRIKNISAKNTKIQLFHCEALYGGFFGTPTAEHQQQVLNTILLREIVQRGDWMTRDTDPYNPQEVLQRVNNLKNMIQNEDGGANIWGLIRLYLAQRKQ